MRAYSPRRKGPSNRLTDRGPGPTFRAGRGKERPVEGIDSMTIDDLLRFMVNQEASDLHLKPMRPPLLRMKGKLLPLKTDPLHPDLLREMIGGLLSERM